MLRHSLFILFGVLNLFGCRNPNNESHVNSFKENSINDSHNIALVNDSNSIILAEFEIANEDFESILLTSLNEYIECKRTDFGYHFSISIRNAKIQDSLGVKSIFIAVDSIDSKESFGAMSLYISRSFHKEFVSRGYGYYYYKDYLFILEGLYLDDVFKKTGRKRSFMYRQEPIVIFDPPRWFYAYWNKVFYFINSSPCGG